MNSMKIAAGISFLMSGLCIATALAQPNETPQNFVVPQLDVAPQANARPRRVRPAQPAGQITQDLTDFVDVINGKGFFPIAQKWIYGAKVGYFGANEWAREVEENRAGVSIKINDITLEKIAPEEASVVVTYFFDVPADFGDKNMKAILRQERKENLQLKLGANPTFGNEKIWQIVPPIEPLQNFGAADLNNIWATLSFFLSQKQPLDTSEAKAKRSINNLKQLALGVLMFVQDFNARFAFAPQYVQEAIFPYTKNKEIFFVPNTKENYTFNDNLSDKSLAQLASPAQTVLFYEGENEKPVFRYDGKAAVGFADGSVKLITPEEAAKLIWKP